MPPGQYFGSKKHLQACDTQAHLILVKGHRFRFDAVSCDTLKYFQIPEYLHLAWSPVCRLDASASVWRCKLDQVRSIKVCLLFILSNWPDPQCTTCDTWNSTQFTEVKTRRGDKCNSRGAEGTQCMLPIS